MSTQILGAEYFPEGGGWASAHMHFHTSWAKCGHRYTINTSIYPLRVVGLGNKPNGIFDMGCPSLTSNWTYSVTALRGWRGSRCGWLKGRHCLGIILSEIPAQKTAGKGYVKSFLHNNVNEQNGYWVSECGSYSSSDSTDYTGCYC